MEASVNILTLRVILEDIDILLDSVSRVEEVLNGLDLGLKSLRNTSEVVEFTELDESVVSTLHRLNLQRNLSERNGSSISSQDHQESVIDRRSRGETFKASGGTLDKSSDPVGLSLVSNGCALVKTIRVYFNVPLEKSGILHSENSGLVVGRGGIRV